MNDIQTLNHKYSTIDSILTREGKLNTRLVIQDWFPKLDIFKDIYNKTTELNEFGDVPFKDRVFFLKYNIQINSCPTCGKHYIFFKNSQNYYRLCNHHIIDKEKNSLIHKNIFKEKKKKLIDSLSDTTLILPDNVLAENIIQYYNKANNFNYSITEKTFNFFHDIIVKTKDILPVDENDLKISERLYLLVHKLYDIPTCLYCSKKVSFRGRNIGYSSTCTEHYFNLATKVRIDNTLQQLRESINPQKYEIVKFPEKMTLDSLIVKCKNCGHESEWNVKNGMLGKLHEKHLCRFCEVNHSVAEEEIYQLIKDNYDGEIIFKSGSRKIIPPYEIDIFLPELKLGIEYDGIYWHSETSGGKPKNYHLMKTNMCEENGIHLIHIFENEWIEKREIIKSRLMNLIGKHKQTIYARKCSIEMLDMKKTKDFLDDNHIQGSCNSRVNIGLNYNNQLVAIMTFSKPRFKKGVDWELVRFCTKIGYHIPGAASKLLKHFERNYHPTKLLSYADRRWSTGKLYKAMGFHLVDKSKPNYWYFKKPDLKLINRVSCQKHRLSKLLQNFDINKTEVENMQNNGYDRIFDCGNLVFVKEYPEIKIDNH